jgi:hypothetical protein
MKQHPTFVIIRKEYQSRVSYELQTYILKSLRDVLFLALEFFIENFMVQVVSSISHIHIPLRDLGLDFLTAIHADIFCFNFEISVETLAIMWVFFCFLHGPTGLAVIQKGARCLTMVRSLRICIFTLTVLPSPKPFCRFHGPIRPFKALIGGACNDLLYSGHVTVYTLTGVAFTILTRKYSSRILRYGLPGLIWCHVLQRVICTIIKRHHYSIDMLLGFIVTLLFWQCKPLYIDLPKVPENLSLHLKQLFFPKYRSILKEV